MSDDPTPEDPLAPYRSGSAEPWVVDVLCSMIRALDATSVLETGTFEAKTTFCLSSAMSGGLLTTLEMDHDRAEAAKACVDRWPYRGVGVQVIETEALAALSQFHDNSFDFIFVDDHHDAIHVAKEMREVLRILRPGGIACFHDVVGHFGLAQVVIAAGGIVLPFRRLHAAGGLGIVSKLG